jgi:hypothetical protein
MGRTQGPPEELCLKQTKLMSLVEAIANVVVGYGVAVLTQLIVFPWFGLPARIDDALALGAIFTGVSIARSFALRPLFETVRIRTAERRSASGGTAACRT